jgi:polar amino acid transport system substrate-binding protein
MPIQGIGVEKMDKKYILLIVIILGFSALIISDEVWVTEKEKPVVISGHPDWAPIMWRDGDKISGAGIEVTKEVFEEIGLKVESRYLGNWDVVQERAKKGETVIVALYKTKAREEYLLYSIPYIDDPIVLFFKENKGFIYNQKEDLLNKRGIATVGDSYGQEMDDYIAQNLNMIIVSTPNEAFSLLKEEKGDYFIYSLYAGEKVIKMSNLSGFEKSEVVSSQPFYIGVPKNSPSAKYMSAINSSLKKMISDGRIDQLIAEANR